MTQEQILQLVENELVARRDQVARFRHRDRSLPQTTEFPIDRDLAIAMTELLHRWGSDDIDPHITRVELLRDQLLAGRFPARGSAVADELGTPVQRARFRVVPDSAPTANI
ncbi:hypothetical protein [Nocardia sp. NPDC059239]|uniref:hypothetical protein n=1 Tax=unclassified Nocardia TaxID=2637762 RepID=UPI0036ADD436